MVGETSFFIITLPWTAAGVAIHHSNYHFLAFNILEALLLLKQLFYFILFFLRCSSAAPLVTSPLLLGGIWDFPSCGKAPSFPMVSVSGPREFPNPRKQVFPASLSTCTHHVLSFLLPALLLALHFGMRCLDALLLSSSHFPHKPGSSELWMKGFICSIQKGEYRHKHL